MNSTSLLIVVVVAVIALVVIGLIVAAVRRSGMHTLPDETKQRYAESWRQIQAHFVEDPTAAVREADQLAVTILQERGAKLDEGHMPKELRSAREAAQRTEGRPTEGRTGTEEMRRSMLGYQKIVDDAIGTANRKLAKEGRREAA